MIQIEHHNDIAILTMDAGENRWNTTFVRAFAAALDEIEASDSVNALVTNPATQNSSRMAWILSGVPAMAIIQGAIETRLVLSLWG